MACGLALLASGQAFAATFATKESPTTITSAGDLSDPTKWVNSSCGGSTLTTVNITNADMIIICSGDSLNLSTTVTLEAATIKFFGGTWGGTGLKFAGAGGFKTIINVGGTTKTFALDLSAMTAGTDSIAIGEEVGLTSSGVTFSSITPNTKGLDCGGAYSPGTLIPINTACQVTAVTPPPAVSAPIFSTKEKPAVFSEEVK